MITGIPAPILDTCFWLNWLLPVRVKTLQPDEVITMTFDDWRQGRDPVFDGTGELRRALTKTRFLLPAQASRTEYLWRMKKGIKATFSWFARKTSSVIDSFQWQSTRQHTFTTAKVKVRIYETQTVP